MFNFENELKELDVNLTIVGLCAALLLPIFLYLFVTLAFTFDNYLVEVTKNSLVYLMRTDSYYVDVMAFGLNALGYLWAALAGWVAINFTHMICLAFDDIESGCE